jgi:glycosyl transferase family 25
MPGEAVGGARAHPFHTLYINRDKDEGRRQLIERQLTQAGLEASRVPAVEGYDLPPDVAPYFADVVTGQQPIMSAGEVGCYGSHLKAWKQIVIDQAPATLILEDDAVLDDGLPHLVREALAALPPGWDLVHLARTRRRHAERPLAHLPCGRTLVRYSRIPPTTAGYLISQRGAAKMLNLEVPRYWPVDTDIRQA